MPKTWPGKPKSCMKYSCYRHSTINNLLPAINTKTRMMKQAILSICTLAMLAACTSKKEYDASGNFEADEVIVSAQQNGILLSYSAVEGKTLKEGDTVAQIDVRKAELQ